MWIYLPRLSEEKGTVMREGGLGQINSCCKSTFFRLLLRRKDSALPSMRLILPETWYILQIVRQIPVLQVSSMRLILPETWYILQIVRQIPVLQVSLFPSFQSLQIILGHGSDLYRFFSSSIREQALVNVLIYRRLFPRSVDF